MADHTHYITDKKVMHAVDLCPPPKVRGGGHIGFSADPVGVGIGVGVGVTDSCTRDIS